MNISINIHIPNRSHANCSTIHQGPSHFRNDMADFKILTDPTSALCWSFGMIRRASFFSNPISHKFYINDLVTKPVAPNTIGVIE